MNVKLPKKVEREIMKKVDKIDFKTPQCRELTLLMAVPYFFIELQFQHTVQLQNDNIPRAEKFEELQQFADKVVFANKKLRDPMQDHAIEKAVAVVCTSQVFVALETGKEENVTGQSLLAAVKKAISSIQLTPNTLTAGGIVLGLSLVATGLLGWDQLIEFAKIVFGKD